MEKSLCPVCGYPDLDEPAYDQNGSPSFDICPCCGYQFGHGDPKTLVGKKNFLRNWIRMGTLWSYPSAKPSNWDVKRQLQGIGMDFDELTK